MVESEETIMKDPWRGVTVGQVIFLNELYDRFFSHNNLFLMWNRATERRNTYGENYGNIIQDRCLRYNDGICHDVLQRLAHVYSGDPLDLGVCRTSVLEDLDKYAGGVDMREVFSSA